MKIKNLSKFMFALSALFLATSCIINIDGVVGKGTVSEEDINVSEFSTIEVNSSAEVVVNKGSECKVTLSDYENLLEYWDIEVVNNTLMIKTKPFSSLMNSKAKVYVTLPGGLKEAKVTGSGDIKLNSTFNSLEKATVSGSGSIRSYAASSYSSLKINISGSGYVTLSGDVDELSTTTSGSGKMNLYDLQAYNAECRISGSGDMYVSVTNWLKADITGSGDITYSGNPELDVNTSGSGRVRHK